MSTLNDGRGLRGHALRASACLFLSAAAFSCATRAPIANSTGQPRSAAERAAPVEHVRAGRAEASGPSRQTSDATSPALLLDVWSEAEAQIVAVVDGMQWQDPSEAGIERLRQIASRGAAYVRLPSLGPTPTTATGTGTLAGSVRESCQEYRVGLSDVAASLGFAVVGTVASPRTIAPSSEPVRAEHVAVVAALLREAGGIRVKPVVDRAHSMDLDGDGRPEWILEATHPALAGDPPKYKRDYYSVLVVVPGATGAEPVYTGYLQATQGSSAFEVLTLDSVADIDRDGKVELLVRTRHAEGTQTQIFRYAGKLEELFRTAGGEGECEEPQE